MKNLKHSFLALAIALIAGCGGAARGGGASHAGEVAAEYAGPIASTDAKHGALRFDDVCGMCHPDGEEDIGPSLLNKRLLPGHVRKQIREGSDDMRPIGLDKLSDEDMEAVLAYLVSLGAVKGDTAEPAGHAGGPGKGGHSDGGHADEQGGGQQGGGQDEGAHDSERSGDSHDGGDAGQAHDKGHH
ncbi:MAG: cytochrome c [Proteobacteria bacterium]|nr:cytochrome c [Pseudomonadota bacterium]